MSDAPPDSIQSVAIQIDVLPDMCNVIQIRARMADTNGKYWDWPEPATLTEDLTAEMPHFLRGLANALERHFK